MKALKYLFSLLLCLTIFFISACDKLDHDPEMKWLNKTKALIEHNSEKISIGQGIAATVLFTEGNCMPTVWPASNNCRTYPVRRVVHIYEYTLHTQTNHAGGGFHTKVNSKRIAKITSDIEGFFEISLVPGKYSIFVEENNMLYANGWDGQGGVQSIEVTAGEVSFKQIPITYKAYY